MCLMAQILTLIFASLPAGLATTLYVAFHFHDLAPYGVLDKLTAMAVVSACCAGPPMPITPARA
jgi:predicted membrane metal-binding protein